MNFLEHLQISSGVSFEKGRKNCSKEVEELLLQLDFIKEFNMDTNRLSSTFICRLMKRTIVCDLKFPFMKIFSLRNVKLDEKWFILLGKTIANATGLETVSLWSVQCITRGKRRKAGLFYSYLTNLRCLTLGIGYETPKDLFTLYKAFKESSCFRDATRMLTLFIRDFQIWRNNNDIRKLFLGLFLKLHHQNVVDLGVDVNSYSFADVLKRNNMISYDDWECGSRRF